MKFDNIKFDDNLVRLRPIAVELRVRKIGSAAGCPPALTLTLTLWQRMVLALVRVVFGNAGKHFDDRRSRNFPVPYLAQDELRVARIPAPAAAIANGPGARIIPFPQKSRRAV
jgi:hypothetical protein